MEKTLSSQFMPKSYYLYLNLGINGDKFKGTLVIRGHKMPPPSRRITLHQTGLKITFAEIIKKDKKGDVKFPVTRINHLKTFQQVRLHTDEMLYPGIYEINIEYTRTFIEDVPALIENEKNWPNENWRNILPSIDEADARKNSEFDFSYLETKF